MGLGKARDAAVLTQRAKIFSSSREDLVGVALMPHVKNQPIPPGIIDPMQGDCQLHDAQIGRQMAAGFGYAPDQAFPDLGAQRLQSVLRQFFYVFRTIDFL
jgi:hypothetical protein